MGRISRFTLAVVFHSHSAEAGEGEGGETATGAREDTTTDRLAGGGTENEVKKAENRAEKSANTRDSPKDMARRPPRYEHD